MRNTAKALDTISQKFGLQIVFVSMSPSDEDAIDEVRTAMDLPSAFPKHEYRPNLAVALIQNACLCLTMKHHPIVFAMAGAVPTVAMTFDDYYHHKNYGAMKIFHQESLLIKGHPDQLEQQIFEKVKEAFSRREELSFCISEVADELSSMSGEAISVFIENRLSELSCEGRI